jgi:hypothetical protein
MILSGLILAALAGCSNHHRAPVYPVHGQVLLNGKPLSDAIVAFHAPEHMALDAFPAAHTDADGRFELTSYEHNDGAPEGAYTISVVCFRARSIRRGQEGRADNVVPQRYANPASSGLSATVASQSNDLPAIKLKSP